MSYFKINNQKYNYIVEFNDLNKSKKWKSFLPVIEYCSQLNIKIPQYCYHKDLSIAGNCRMCLIELNQSNKPIISCAVNAMSTLVPNAKVYTNSPVVKKARENILEFLLLNHPLDCPICDQGGQCDLQDQSFFFGFTKKRFFSYKRIVIDKNIGLLVKTVMTRCIHCTRCVRFASEIAGVEDLGGFGRSFSNEIGTYVEKTFQSEISGNIIDICPVGALTSKYYQHSDRIWESKRVNDIDYSDGFALDIILQTKNKKISKIQSDCNKNKTEWISDKTRFSFDSLFSSEFSFKTTQSDKVWSKLFKKFIQLLYLYDHLSRHNFKTKSLILIFGDSLNNESINLVCLLAKKYRFVRVRKNIKTNNSIDIEQYFKLDNLELPVKIKECNFCFLVGINSRYESFYFNIVLRKRVLKGNFKILVFNSFINSTYLTKTLSTNPESLKLISEGNHIVTQVFRTSTKPLFILNQRAWSRFDSQFFLTTMLLIEDYSAMGKKNVKGTFNLLANSLNSIGINSKNEIVGVSNKDFKISNSLFFLNSSVNDSPNLNKILKLKLFNYLTEIGEVSKTGNKIINLSPYNNAQRCTYLPSSHFFESSGTFINTQSVWKLSTKVVSANLGSKNDWEIVRILLSNSVILNLLHTSQKLIFLNWNLNRFRNFILFLVYASQNLSNLSFFLRGKSQNVSNKLIKFKRCKMKFLRTKLKRYIYDFYTTNESYYSKFSLIMIQCSNTIRFEKTNFEHIFSSCC